MTRKPTHCPNENPVPFGTSFPIFIYDNWCLIPQGKKYLLEGRAAMVTPTSEFPRDRTKFHFRKQSSVLFNHFTSSEILQELTSTGSSISKSSLCQQLLKSPYVCLNSNQNWNNFRTNLRVQHSDKYIYYWTYCKNVPGLFDKATRDVKKTLFEPNQHSSHLALPMFWWELTFQNS